MDYHNRKETTKPKYVNIVAEIREIIRKDQLKPGDKIPSERDLSARLGAGRSSVREALRALELIGIIETKRGEGTFLKNVTENQLVHVLGTFLLQMNQSKKDLIQTKMLIEKEAIRSFCHEEQADAMLLLGEVIDKKKQISNVEYYYSFFSLLVNKTGNFLLYRIWEIINEYTLPIYKEREIELDFTFLYEALKKRGEKEALEEYKKIIDLFR